MRLFVSPVATLMLSAASCKVSVEAFVRPSTTFAVSYKQPVSDVSTGNQIALFARQDQNNDNIVSTPCDGQNNKHSNDGFDLTSTTFAATSMMTWLATSNSANAAGPDWGIFEGRTGSLLHPIMMGSLLLYSLYTGFLGLQWRTQRTIGDEIADLKKQIPDLPGDAATLAEGVELAKTNDDEPELRRLQNALPIQKEIDEKVALRKELSSQGNRDKHFNQGALLAFLGTAFAIEGPLNTYARAGKLFPGPHLYAGAGLVVCWSLAVACVPAMQKGNDTARSIHIGANVGGLALFVWQVTSGIPILLKVIEKTSWP